MTLTRRSALALPLALWATRYVCAETPKTGVFVAVGYGGRRLRSIDGVNWEITAEWTTNGGDNRDNLISVVFGNGKFVAVGGGVTDKNGLGGRILTSPDGKTWTEHPGRSFRVAPVLFGNGRFVAGGPDYHILHSTDGATWETGGKIADPSATHFRIAAFGNGTFVFGGNGGPPEKRIQWMITSKDGTTIDSERTDLPPLGSMTFGNGRFVAVGGTDGLRMSSADGITWEHETREPKLSLETVIWTGKQFVTAGEGKGFTSPDGKTWTPWPKTIRCSLLYANEAKGIWIGSTWPGNMWSSPDGLEWKQLKMETPDGMNSVAYGEIG